MTRAQNKPSRPSATPKGSLIPAQGNALGSPAPALRPCKGHSSAPIRAGLKTLCMGGTRIMILGVVGGTEEESLQTIRNIENYFGPETS